MRELRGEYLIAANGAHSKVRQCLGIGYEGRGAFSNSVTLYFTADLSPWNTTIDRRIQPVPSGATTTPLRLGHRARICRCEST